MTYFRRDNPRSTPCLKGLRDHIVQQYGDLSAEWLATYDDDWEDGSCLRPEGHSGRCRFVPNDEILVSLR